MPEAAKACRCGAALVPNGTCTHCDVPRRCTAYDRNAGCLHCRRRDSWCLICREWRITPAHAAECETSHRQQERASKT